MATVASAVFPMAGAASRQVSLAFRLTPGPVPCQTPVEIVCVIPGRYGTPGPEPCFARPAG